MALITSECAPSSGTKCAQLYCVDLAGSERVRKTETAGLVSHGLQLRSLWIVPNAAASYSRHRAVD